MTDFAIQLEHLADVVAALTRFEQRAADIQRDEVQRAGVRYRDALRDATPVGKGERPGTLKKGYRTQMVSSGLEAIYSIKNEVPHLQYVLGGRGPVEARPGKSLRFVINGEVFFRKRVKAAKANPFDTKVEKQQASDVDGIAERTADRLVQEWGR